MRSSLSGLAGLTLAIFAASGTPAPASIITTATGTGADSYIRSGANADLNFGTDTTIIIKADQADAAGDFNRKGYFRFDLTTATDLPTATAASLTFTLESGSSGRVFNVFGLIDGTSGEVFTESGAGGITWNTAPGNDSASGGGAYNTGTKTGGGVNNAVTTFLGTFTLSTTTGGTPYSISTPELLSFLQADTNSAATFILTSASIQTAAVDSFRTKENAAGSTSYPKLTIVPEPATAVMLLGGLGMVGIIRRRRPATR